MLYARQLSACEVLLLTRPRWGRGSPQEECCVWRFLDKGTGRLVRADLLSSLICSFPLGNVKDKVTVNNVWLHFASSVYWEQSASGAGHTGNERPGKRLSLVMFGSQLAFLYCDKVNLARIKHWFTPRCTSPYFCLQSGRCQEWLLWELSWKPFFSKSLTVWRFFFLLTCDI